MRRPIYINHEMRRLIADALAEHAKRLDDESDEEGVTEEAQWQAFRQAQDCRHLRDLLDECDELIAYR